MSAQDYNQYEVVARRRGAAPSDALRAPLGNRPFHIGSSSESDLHLPGATLLPTHVRLFLTSAGGVMFTNLGATGTVRLDDEPLMNFAAVLWQPGQVIYLGEFALDLQRVSSSGSTVALEPDPMDDAFQEDDRPYLGTLHVNKLAPQDIPDDLLPHLPPDAQLDLAGEEPDYAPEATRPDMRPAFARPAAAPSRPPAPSVPAAVAAPAPSTDEFDDFPPRGEFSPLMTLPKDWQHAGRLSAQLPINPVKLVAGERVRIPVSVRNSYDHPLSLRVYVAGVPRAWVNLPETPIKVADGEMTSFDVVLATQPPVDGETMDMKIRLSDPDRPDAAIVLTLMLNFKREANLVGYLAPIEAPDTDPAFLTLHNHTQAATEVYIAPHVASDDLRVTPAQVQVNLPPGQDVRVPIQFAITERPLLRPRSYSYSISAVQGSRAPMDFTGRVRVKPRLPAWLLAVPGVVLLALVLLLALGGGGGAPPPTATPTASLTPTERPTRTPRPTATPEEETPSGDEALPGVLPGEEETPALDETPDGAETPSGDETLGAPDEAATTAPDTSPAAPTELPALEATATAIAGPTETPADPRPATCTEPIPEGWVQYTVERGDTAFRLATDRDTTVDEVARVNCLADPRQLSEGQILLLPGT